MLFLSVYCLQDGTFEPLSYDTSTMAPLSETVDASQYSVQPTDVPAAYTEQYDTGMYPTQIIII